LLGSVTVRVRIRIKFI
jgi:hypothetical protein